ncbi:uncharacterized protein PHACADRAFT_33588 [Phanerochaete carnosa HHB-10118-sp]|uniref:Uncharacterized protein n=1 Tax=Phanerochaete carnosa (strain HHB-10118-sp) TaxID=650164 RepID=K5VDI1_PHACS|nr:uncharacterized protein PHACADRAFT_33588 [Phanerochaete carnosa HHB-10118-sp]EKM49188.1 hypothetical protein PHACADRAFT_33588 [Phanerochaete carnosa HHB-10118-sp]
MPVTVVCCSVYHVKNMQVLQLWINAVSSLKDPRSIIKDLRAIYINPCTADIADILTRNGSYYLMIRGADGREAVFTNCMEEAAWLKEYADMLEDMNPQAESENANMTTIASSCIRDARQHSVAEPAATAEQTTRSPTVNEMASSQAPTIVSEVSADSTADRSECGLDVKPAAQARSAAPALSSPDSEVASQEGSAFHSAHWSNFRHIKCHEDAILTWRSCR